METSVLQLENNTGYSAARACLVNRDGDQVWVVVVKVTYLLNDDGTVKEHPEQEAVTLGPVFLGEPGKSSLLREGELVTSHPGTDVTLLANAHAPAGYSTTKLQVGVAVGSVRKVLQVTGDRFWDNSLVGMRMTPPAPFTVMPISYERAYGGTNVFGDAGEHEEHDSRNPIGQGFASSPAYLAGKPLPNIEDPDYPLRTWKDRSKPSGLCPVPVNWSPRLELAGTFDSAWRTQRAPLLPSDYDERHTLSAPPDLVSTQPLRGGEQVVLTNLTPTSELRFRLPRPHLALSTSTKRGRIRQDAQLDRVIIEPDARKLVMVWRSSLICGSRIRDVYGTTIDSKPRIRL